MSLINNYYQIGFSITFEYLVENILLVLWISISSILIKRFNFITLILAVELMVISLVLIVISLYIITEDISIEIFILYILGILAVETGIILAIIIKYYQTTRESSLEKIKNIKG
jgi:NADH:ubiquinone oxidoreductase subunit K